MNIEQRVASDQKESRPLSDLIEGFWLTQVIGAAVALGIPDMLRNGAKSCEHIALSCGADASCVMRVLRALQTLGVCRQVGKGTFELTERGQILRRDAPGSITGRVMFTSGIMWDLYSQLTTVVKTGCPLPAGREGFRKLASHPGLRGMHLAMVESSIRVVRDAARVHDFRGYSRVLDVGGGYGGALAALLEDYPDMSGGVLDLDYLADGANTYFRDRGVAKQAQFLAGDFFESVPGGYDCYLLKYIVHDWGDTEALEILHRCAAAASRQSHLLLFERVLPEVLDESGEHQAIMQIDLAMMTTGGKERTKEEYRMLLESAGFRMIAVTATASPCSVIHAVRAA
jgi:hypothetical protein